ncbi:hypothetical protein DLAC_01538 [Tieghemostelium lacteum]|uniref:Transmembrane protein n=1 Tax=Tieghemostelium lacteum TaxID=361077 RepID=A0A152A5N8_TIELA|nr:hypothetical protein DLAC_01538 [Tieghemostelium lacteum]|eukprot:KYR01544.1 hypothetical protein DLAC_01538 [Tieghemostelium lacteum]
MPKYNFFTLNENYDCERFENFSVDNIPELEDLSKVQLKAVYNAIEKYNQLVHTSYSRVVILILLLLIAFAGLTMIYESTPDDINQNGSTRLLWSGIALVLVVIIALLVYWKNLINSTQQFLVKVTEELNQQYKSIGISFIQIPDSKDYDDFRTPQCVIQVKYCYTKKQSKQHNPKNFPLPHKDIQIPLYKISN